MRLGGAAHPRGDDRRTSTGLPHLSRVAPRRSLSLSLAHARTHSALGQRSSQGAPRAQPTRRHLTRLPRVSTACSRPPAWPRSLGLQAGPFPRSQSVLLRRVGSSDHLCRHVSLINRMPHRESPCQRATRVKGRRARSRRSGLGRRARLERRALCGRRPRRARARRLARRP